VADLANNRVVSFVLNAGIPAIVSTGVPKLSSDKKKSTFTFYIANTSSNADIFTSGITIPSGTKKLATLTFLAGGVDITSALTSNSYTQSFAASSQVPITVKVVPKSKAKKGGTIQFTATATSITQPSNTASGTVEAKFKKSTKK
jgi:hypothetical protein